MLIKFLPYGGTAQAPGLVIAKALSQMILWVHRVLKHANFIYDGPNTTVAN